MLDGWVGRAEVLTASCKSRNHGLADELELGAAFECNDALRLSAAIFPRAPFHEKSSVSSTPTPEPLSLGGSELTKANGQPSARPLVPVPGLRWAHSPSALQLPTHPNGAAPQPDEM